MGSSWQWLTVLDFSAVLLPSSDGFPYDRDVALLQDRVPARCSDLIALISSVSMSVTVVLKRPVGFGIECRELPEAIPRLCHS